MRSFLRVRRYLLLSPALFLLAGCHHQATAGVPHLTSQAPFLPEGVTDQMMAQGELLFTSRGVCWVCHMEGAKGGPLGPDLTDGNWLGIDGSYESIVSTVMGGVLDPVEHPAPMLPRGGTDISEDEVRAVAAYVWNLNNAP